MSRSLIDTRVRDNEVGGPHTSDADGAGILHEAGMVRRTKQGSRTVYAISDPGVFELCDQICGGVRRQLQELDVLLQQPTRSGS